MRNLCAHYGRLWNRAFDVTIDAPGQARKDADDLLAPLAYDGTNNRLYGVLLVMRHLLLSIAPEKGEVVNLADFVEDHSRSVGFGMAQLGFPDDWRSSPIWDRAFALDRSPMVAASLLDRAEWMTAAEPRASLTGAEVRESNRTRTPAQAARAKKAAQRSLLRTYLKHRVVIEVELGGTKFYPAFQFQDGKIIDALAEINKELASSCGGADPTGIARALFDWWRTLHPDLPKDADGVDRSPLDLLSAVSEEEFDETVRGADAMGSFVVPDRHLSELFRR